MKERSGFRIEVSPRSKLGKRLSNLSIYLRNRSDAVGDVKVRRWIRHPDFGFIEGVWTVRKSGVISFKGVSSSIDEFEFVYGKLTIGKYLWRPGYQEPLPYQKSIRLFLKLIDLMFPDLGNDPLTLDLKLTRKDK